MSNIYKIFSVVFLFSVLVKLFDIAKALIVSAYLGVSGNADVFLSIISIPDGILILVGIDSLRGIVNSEFSHYRLIAEPQNISNSFRNLLYIIIMVSSVILAAILMFKEEIVSILLPGFTNEKLFLAVSIAGIVFPVFFLKGIIGFFQSIFNAHKKFYLPVLLPVIVSISIIVSSIFSTGDDKSTISNFSYAYLIGNGLVLVAIIIGVTKIIKINDFFNFSFDPITKKILKSSLTLLVLVISNQLFFYSKNFFASYFSNGAIASLSYAASIPNILTTIVFSSVFSVLLSNLSSAFVEKNRAYTKKMFLDSYLILLSIFVPIIVILLVEGNEILELVYYRGNFGPDGVSKTILPFYWESIATLAWLTYILPTAFFLSKKKYKLMTIIGASIYILGILFNFMFSFSLGYYGLSVANFIVMSLHGIFLFLYLRRYFGRIKEFSRKVITILTIGIICFFLVFFIKIIIQDFFEYSSKYLMVLELVIITIITFSIYLLISNFFKLNYLYNAKKLFSRV